MVVILGESCSGKSTLQKYLVESNGKYKKAVSYTTRPMRNGEVDGIDYHFISDKKFDKREKNGFFAEHSSYRGWRYGVSKEDCKQENLVAVLTPAGFRKLKQLGYDITSVYLYVDRRSRLISNLLRGDDIDESIRRNLSDVGQFDGVLDEVDYVIDNTDYHMTKDQTLACLQKILEVNISEKH